MKSTHIEELKRKIIEVHGSWTAHNIHLGEGVFTIGHDICGDNIKLNRILQIVRDLTSGPPESLRILDLGCLEGLYSTAFASQGASVVAIEGRQSNLAKAQFAKAMLGLKHLTLLHEDVRCLNPDRHGFFDVVLCLGLLYHLDAPDVFCFLQQISEVCQHFAVFDTHICQEASANREFAGRTFWGSVYNEHAPDASMAQKLAAPWASLDNTASFWLTRQSLIDALDLAGFSSVFECHLPFEPNKPADRLTLVAMKGQKVMSQT
ncbi:MAG: class I SAM-dependent methyltransferase [Pirellulales bacterium]